MSEYIVYRVSGNERAMIARYCNEVAAEEVRAALAAASYAETSRETPNYVVEEVKLAPYLQWVGRMHRPPVSGENAESLK